eukprot:Clim_evm11s232 gene=Clim_evmTU11s232
MSFFAIRSALLKGAGRSLAAASSINSSSSPIIQLTTQLQKSATPVSFVRASLSTYVGTSHRLVTANPLISMASASVTKPASIGTVGISCLGIYDLMRTTYFGSNGTSSSLLLRSVICERAKSGKASIRGDPFAHYGKKDDGGDVSTDQLDPKNREKSKRPEISWGTLWRCLKDDALLLVAAVLTALAVAFINIEIPTRLGKLINVVTAALREGSGSGGSGADALGSAAEQLKEPALALLGLYLVQSFLTSTYIVLLAYVGENMALRLRHELFSAIIVQEMAFFDSHRSGELVDRLTSDVQDFKSAFKQVVSQGLRSVAQLIGAVFSLWRVSKMMTLVMVTGMPLIFGVGSLLGAGLRRMSARSNEEMARATAVAAEAVGNVRTVRAFAMEDTEKDEYFSQALRANQAAKRLGWGIGLFQGMSNLAINGITLGVLGLGGSLVVQGTIEGGDLMSFLVLAQGLQRSFANLSILFGSMVRGTAAGSRVFEFMDRKPQIPTTGGLTKDVNSVLGELELKDVSFTYPTRPDHQVFHQLSVTFEAGKVTALCGPSGGGKSTIAGLLERFYDPDDQHGFSATGERLESFAGTGRVLMDGTDIRDLDPSWMRRKVLGFINQEPTLFHTTVMENIRYGRPEASDEEVMEAARQANAHGFISRFPNGYNTVVGERGQSVSGGQRQRIAIARAILKDPKVLILDEATSALDAESESVVQEALERLMKGRTVIVIAHRLSTIQNADRIIVLKGGRVAESGTHFELMKRKGLYADLVKHQTKV